MILFSSTSSLEKASGPSGYAPVGDSPAHDGGYFPGACGASVLLHGAILALLAGLTLAVKESVEETVAEPRPFVLVAEPGHTERTSTASDGNVGGPVSRDEKARAENLFVAPPSVRTWVPPRPAREESTGPVVAEPKPRATETVRPAPSQTRRPSPKSGDATQSPRTTYDKFLERMPSRGGPQVASEGNEGRVTRPHISAPRAGEGSGPGTEPGTNRNGPATADGMTAYFGDLIQRLRDSHEKPGGLSDVLNAEVQFTLAANGTISNLRIVRSSGSAEFDRSVLEAFARVKMPARPDKRTDVQQLTFRIREA